MVEKHFLQMRDNVGCRILKRNVKSGAMFVGNTNIVINEQRLENRQPIKWGAGKVTDLRQSDTETDGDRSTGLQST